MAMRPWLMGLLGLAAGAAAAMFVVKLERPPPGAKKPLAKQSHKIIAHQVAREPEIDWDCIAWDRVGAVLAGGGAEPESNQVSIEQDLALATRAFGSREQVVLFAGGAGADGVQIADPKPEGDLLLHALGELFDPREGRGAHYRPSTLDIHGAATVDHVKHALERATQSAAGASPLIVYLAAHGEQGQTPRENVIRLWGGGALSVDQLDVATRGPRPVRLVIAACFSGGFAELAMPRRDGNPDRCGFFASTWDTQSSGCDPNPDRRVQEGYSIHFLHALLGEDREGKKLAPDDIDFDGDGNISLYEAHSRVRIASASLDIPTTTAEQWLRATAKPGGRRVSFSMPEEEAVVSRLGAHLGLTQADAEVRLDELEQRRVRLETTLEDRAELEDERWAALRIALLERWPVLDDPWHPRFRRTLVRDRDAITQFIEQAPLAQAFRQAGQDVAETSAELEDLWVDLAPVYRLVRAQENLRLAEQLRARGGSDWKRFEALRSCERTPLK